MAQQYPDEPTPSDPTTPTPNPNPGGPGDASGQYATDDQIRLLYKEWLWRDPSEAEIAMHRNAPFAEVKANIVNSPEHKEKWTNQVQAWARELLGRELSPADLASAMQGGLTNIQSVRNGITNSTEYRQRQAAGQTPAPTTPAPATGGTSAYNASLEGFDANKFNDPTHTTTKYAFARLAAKYPATQAGYAQLIADPALAALGFKGDGKGNIIAIDGRNSQYGVSAGEKIDVMRGYGSGGQGWQWLTADTTPASTPAPAPTLTPTAMPPASTGGGTGSGNTTLADLAAGQTHLNQAWGQTFDYTPWAGSGVLGSSNVQNYTGGPALKGLPAYQGNPVAGGPGGWNESTGTYTGGGVTATGDPRQTGWDPNTGMGPSRMPPTQQGGGGQFNWTAPEIPAFTFNRQEPQSFSFGQYQTPAAFSYDQKVPDPFSYADFKAPTEADMAQDPSYKVRFAEGQRALDSSAAANGSLMTGGTLKALAKYGQDQASKEYANIYGRNLNTYGTNLGKAQSEYASKVNAQKTGYDQAFQAWGANADNGYRGYTTNRDTAKSAYDSAYDQYKNAFAQATTGYGINAAQKGATFDRNLQATQAKDAIAYRDALANYNQQYGQYQDRYKMWLEDQNRQFDQMYKLASLGLTAGSNSY